MNSNNSHWTLGRIQTNKIKLYTNIQRKWRIIIKWQRRWSTTTTAVLEIQKHLQSEAIRNTQTQLTNINDIKTKPNAVVALSHSKFVPHIGIETRPLSYSQTPICRQAGFFFVFFFLNVYVCVTYTYCVKTEFMRRCACNEIETQLILPYEICTAIGGDALLPTLRSSRCWCCRRLLLLHWYGDRTVSMYCYYVYASIREVSQCSQRRPLLFIRYYWRNWIIIIIIYKHSLSVRASTLSSLQHTSWLYYSVWFHHYSSIFFSHIWKIVVSELFYALHSIVYCAPAHTSELSLLLYLVFQCQFEKRPLRTIE